MLLYEKDGYTIHANEGAVTDTVLSFFAANYNASIDLIEEELIKYESMQYEKAMMLLLYYDNEPVGVICGYRLEDSAIEEHFFISPGHRGRINAKVLFKLFIKWAKAVDCKEIVYRRKQYTYEKEI